MKKIISILMTIMVMFGSFTYAKAAQPSPPPNPIAIIRTGGNQSLESWIIVDINTGVNYIVISRPGQAGGITISPRLNPDQTLYITSSGAME